MDMLMNKKYKIIFSKTYLLIFPYTLSVFTAIIVFITNGTSGVFPNLMYIPISIAAQVNGKKHGITHAIISGLLVGPFMPLNVSTNSNQATTSWILRLIIYVSIAATIGFFSDYYKQMIEVTKNKNKEISEAQMATIYSLVKLSEYRDIDTGKHIERVAISCKLLANKLRHLSKYQSDIDDNYIDNIYKASPLHDIGKVGVPDKVLLKPGKFTPEEYEVMKIHTTIGANTLLDVKKKYPDNDFIEMGIYIALSHHEKWDGSGYPSGLSGENIPLSARITALVDAYDALRSKRVYKDAYSHEESLKIIKQDAGKHFDPNIVQTFIEYGEEFKRTFEEV